MTVGLERRVMRQPNPEREMNREEWIARCAAHYGRKAHLEPKQAYEAAVACFEANEDDDSPEYMANEDMDCWTDDAV